MRTCLANEPRARRLYVRQITWPSAAIARIRRSEWLNLAADSKILPAWRSCEV